jgi:Serine dehydrogenase proteinase
MGNWNSIINEIHASPFDLARRKYAEALHTLTGRNTLYYYSGWLQKTDPRFFNVVSITDEDKGGFMTCLHGMQFEAGLDLILHSPGGYVSATESLIHYLRQKFGANIRVFVPQIAMSGGTILALAGEEIWMGHHSNLGPIDPQFGNRPAVTLIEEFVRAYREIKKDKSKLVVWQPILAQIAPTMLSQARDAIDLSKQIAERTLTDGMFRTRRNKERLAKKISTELTKVTTHKQHSRHIHFADCQKIGLNVKQLESDPTLQDAVLSAHHAFMITLSNTNAGKIIQSHHGMTFVKNVTVQAAVQQLPIANPIP